MERGQKIALVGTNGIGKTTLLRSLLGLNKPISGSVEQGENLEIGYFEQEVKGENKTTCIEELWQEFPSFSQYEVRSALAKCGLTTKHIESQVRVLSGGEQAKVRLCKLVNRDTNILLLDEPTNHLDMESITALNNGLIKFPGVVLFASRDHQVVQTTANRIIEFLPDGTFIDKVSTYDEYLENDEMARKRQVYNMSSDDENDN